MTRQFNVCFSDMSEEIPDWKYECKKLAGQELDHEMKRLGREYTVKRWNYEIKEACNCSFEGKHVRVYAKVTIHD